MNKHVEVIGEEGLRIGRALTRPPIKGSSASLTFVTGGGPFDPRRELKRLLSSPPIYSAEQLQEAEAAVSRLSSCKEEDLMTWAKKLGDDFSRFED